MNIERLRSGTPTKECATVLKMKTISIRHWWLVPTPSTCPFPAGIYIIDNYFVDISKVPPNFDGRFRFRMLQRHLGKLIDELNSFVEIRHYNP
jgi:hypothetical protein